MPTEFLLYLRADEFPTIPKRLCNLPATNEPASFLSNQSPYGLTAKTYESFALPMSLRSFPLFRNGFAISLQPMSLASF